ncbi:MAG: hypothetical protein ABSF29_13750, partial [Tepidisphaeraceae bacterium]
MLTLPMAAVAGLALVFFLGSPPPEPAPPATPNPTITPIIAPSQPPPPIAAPTIKTYLDLLHAEFPNGPAFTPLPAALDLTDAAHLILQRRVYVCPRGDIWTMRPDADPLPKVLARAPNETEHIADRDVEYILWTVDSRGDQQASAICRTPGGYELVSASGTQPIPWHRTYRWNSASDWDDNGVTRLIVPTDDGVSIITTGDSLTESYCPLRDSGSGPSPQVLFDLRGLLAWIPADTQPNLNTTVARFVDGQWTILPQSDWPSSIIHLVPMLDGSVLQIRRGDDPQSVQLNIQPLDSPAIDENQIDALVDQLEDPDPDKRTAAFQKLTEFGPGIFPILEKLEPNLPPEAQPRIDQLLEGKIRIKLGGMEIIDDLLTIYSRLSDGGAVFYAPHGVIVEPEKGSPQLVQPAFLVIRPGRSIQLLPGGLTSLLDSNTQLTANHDEWIATRPNVGPMRFLPPRELTPLLRTSELNFTTLVGIDSHGRWIFRPSNAAQPSLILDPTLPDPTPRLAIWLIDTAKQVGWNSANWPVVMRRSDYWMLTDKDWELLPPGDQMQTQPPPERQLLMIDKTGNQYSDGRTTLTV